MKINGVSYDAQIVEYNKYNAKVVVNGIEFAVEFGDDEDITSPVHFIGNTQKPTPEPKAQTEKPAEPKPNEPLVSKVTPPPPVKSDGNLKQVKAPLPGTVNEIKVEIGQTIEENDAVVILEAMKMESEICTEYGGVVRNILVNKGQNVTDGQVMIEIE